jgi:hypothetical protein
MFKALLGKQFRKNPIENFATSNTLNIDICTAAPMASH